MPLSLKPLVFEFKSYKLRVVCPISYIGIASSLGIGQNTNGLIHRKSRFCPKSVGYSLFLFSDPGVALVREKYFQLNIAWNRFGDE
jgi:hypothetical protein